MKANRIRPTLLLGSMLALAIPVPQRAHAGDAQPPKIIIPEKLPEQQALSTAEGRKRARLLELGDKHLAQLQPLLAAGYYRRSLEHLIDWPAGSPFRLDQHADGLHATEGLARAYAELGDFPQAEEWLKTSLSRYPDLCGIGESVRRMVVTGVVKVWQAAALTPQSAEARLRLFIRREVKILPADEELFEAPARGVAAGEATFLLAELLLKQGKTAEARVLLTQVAEQAPYFNARAPSLPKAYLAQLAQGEH